LIFLYEWRIRTVAAHHVRHDRGTQMSELMSQVQPSVNHIRSAQADLEPGPDRTLVARLAYELWQQRGSDGSPVDDWLNAERILRGSPESAITLGSAPTAPPE
jgi:hypothetical protein